MVSREIALLGLGFMAIIYTIGAVFQLRPTERDRERWKRQPNRPPDTFDHFMSWLLVVGLWAVIIVGLAGCTTAPTPCPWPCHLDYERAFAVGLEELIGQWQYDVDHGLMVYELRRQADILELGERANQP